MRAAPCARGGHGDGRRRLQRVAVDAGADRREGDRGGAELGGDLEGPAVGAGEEPRLAVRRPDHTGPTAWTIQRAASPKPSVATADPVGQPPSAAQASSRPGPAAAKIAPHTPPPRANAVFAAFTTTSVDSSVMSPRKASRPVMAWGTAPKVASLQRNPARKRYQFGQTTRPLASSPCQTAYRPVKVTSV